MHTNPSGSARMCDPQSSTVNIYPKWKATVGDAFSAKSGKMYMTLYINLCGCWGSIEHLETDCKF